MVSPSLILWEKLILLIKCFHWFNSVFTIETDVSSTLFFIMDRLLSAVMFHLLIYPPMMAPMIVLGLTCKSIPRCAICSTVLVWRLVMETFSVVTAWLVDR